ncbi:MAG TPA: glycoside hydrolase family 3 C-terminal domain-containing protein, partial [Bacteroidales bacterium]|nr:glycoside hydrolase family 3 C-terminal domain-containing protein [Bacteroidales bacterium]
MLKTPQYRGYKCSQDPDLKNHAQITRQAAADGMVILENQNNALPLSSTEAGKVAAFGNSSYEFISGGTGSGDVNEAYTVSLIEGLKNGGFKPDADLSQIYISHINTMRKQAGKPKNFITSLLGGKEPVAEMEVTPELARRMAFENDLAIITIGRNSGEGIDREPIEGDFYLTKAEKQMIKNVSTAFQYQSKKAIVILNIGGPIETLSWRDFPDAVLLSWQPGQEAGNSVVDILTGKVTPSGKLAVTFPIYYNDSPSSSNFPGHAIEGAIDETKDLSGFSIMKRTPWEVIYKEDVFVGYRY